MKHSLIGFFVGLSFALFGAYMLPYFNLIVWSQEMVPILLTVSFIAYWFCTVYRRDGLFIDEVGESITSAFLIVGTSFCLDLYNFSYGERVVGACVSAALYFVFWLVGYSLSSNSDSRSVRLQ